MFHNHGFKTIAVVCDGASSNMAAIKLLTTAKRGAFGFSDDNTKNIKWNLGSRSLLPPTLMYSALWVLHAR